MQKFFVYLLECRDKSLYCGSTKDLKARIQLHNAGKASKYTRSRKPVKLVFFEECKSRNAALKREIEIKAMTRKQKQAIAMRLETLPTL